MMEIIKPSTRWPLKKSKLLYESEHHTVELVTEKVRELITKGRIPRNRCDDLV